MPAAKEQIRQIIADNNISRVTDGYTFLRDGFKDILQELLKADLDAALGYEKNQNGHLILKYQRDISGIEENTISLCARGMNTRDIHDQLQDLYGIEMSARMASRITDKILPEIREWQSRPLSCIQMYRTVNSV